MALLIDDLRNHAFRRLFVERLGWDNASGGFSLKLGETEFAFQSVAQKRGLRVIHCTADRLVLLDRTLLRKIQREVIRSAHEHILIFSCTVPLKQVWLWCIRTKDGRNLRHREHPFLSESPPAAFLAKLEQLKFDIAEEDEITLIDAVERVRRTLDTSPSLEMFAKRPFYARQGHQLALEMKAGLPGAFQRFIEFHLPLARKTAVKLCGRFGIPPEDAEQIGVLGLIRAAQKFEPERGYQFSTYAMRWIKNFCQVNIPDLAYGIRVPLHAFWRLLAHSNALYRLGQADGRAAAEEFQTVCESADSKWRKQWRGFAAARMVQSLSDPDLKVKVRGLRDPVAAPEAPIKGRDTAMRVREALGKIPERERDILIRRFGFAGTRETLLAIAETKGLTRERIRQLETKALKDMRDQLVDEFPEFENEPIPLEPNDGWPFLSPSR
jgi:RNA polymerase sigma factor (sigma-70 family)